MILFLAVVARHRKPHCRRRDPLTNHPGKEAREKTTGNGTPNIGNASTNILIVGSYSLRVLMIEIEGLFRFLLLQTAERTVSLYSLMPPLIYPHLAFQPLEISHPIVEVV